LNSAFTTHLERRRRHKGKGFRGPYLGEKTRGANPDKEKKTSDSSRPEEILEGGGPRRTQSKAKKKKKKSL